LPSELLKRILASQHVLSDGLKIMRPAVLSIAKERLVSPLRNAVLAHAGYGVIPATSFDAALKILKRRRVNAVVIGHSMDKKERRALCSEAHKLGVPAVVMDPYDQSSDDGCGLHVNPLDGPETFLSVMAALVRRKHRACLV
jgi:DNA-binding LacI/PurR family transcriptional regulator